uniref:EF-hand domain family member D2 n=1 Tax=Rhinopithecus roxellana TaxID=61622 RepID=A0A2K6N7J3_RHIRO
MATDELATKLSRRLQMEGEGGGETPEQPGLNGAAAAAGLGTEQMCKFMSPADLVWKPSSLLTAVQCQDVLSFCVCRYDAGRDGFIDLMELKLMMEKLGAPQTHLGLKNMIKEVDEDFDSKLSFREFLLIFRKAAAGELQEDSGLCVLARLSEIDVSSEGVKGAKSFFEAKVQAINVSSRFEEEIKAEQEERKKQAEEMKQRKAAFKELQSTFK